LADEAHVVSLERNAAICEEARVYATKDNRERELLAEAPDFSDLTVRRQPSLWMKYALDSLGATVLLPCTLPLMAAIAAAVKVTSYGPVVFSQERVGEGGKRFRMYKFRTMRHEGNGSAPVEEHYVSKTPRDSRVTALGRILRRTSLDELPQLVNVLKGEMSLVGPRPLQLEEARRMPEVQAVRAVVRPGMTGLWQVAGRSRLGFEEWMRLDIEYVRRWSLWLDVRILLKTIPAVLRGDGAF
jgi:lipopolysaccharide/colanic/teichoic acid biosynthesis glycosyltransferase